MLLGEAVECCTLDGERRKKKKDNRNSETLDTIIRFQDPKMGNFPNGTKKILSDKTIKNGT